MGPEDNYVMEASEVSEEANLGPEEAQSLRKETIIITWKETICRLLLVTWKEIIITWKKILLIILCLIRRAAALEKNYSKYLLLVLGQELLLLLLLPLQIPAQTRGTALVLIIILIYLSLLIKIDALHTC